MFYAHTFMTQRYFEDSRGVSGYNSGIMTEAKNFCLLYCRTGSATAACKSVESKHTRSDCVQIQVAPYQVVFRSLGLPLRRQSGSRRPRSRRLKNRSYRGVYAVSWGAAGSSLARLSPFGSGERSIGPRCLLGMIHLSFRTWTAGRLLFHPKSGQSGGQ